MPSRDPNDLHPDLRERWEWMRDEWERRHPDAPQPFLTCTYRPASEQKEKFEEGASLARPMQSLHNFTPALAFDIAFDPEPEDGVGNDLTWQFKWFQRWGELAEEIGLEWGGRWAQLVDGPHVQIKMTWQQAQAGAIPPLPPLPGAETEYDTLVIHDGEKKPKIVQRPFVMTVRGGKVDVRFTD